MNIKIFIIFICLIFSSFMLKSMEKGEEVKVLYGSQQGFNITYQKSWKGKNLVEAIKEHFKNHNQPIDESKIVKVYSKGREIFPEEILPQDLGDKIILVIQSKK